MDPRNFDPSHSADLLKHMDKQHEVLTEAHRSMLHELQKLQVLTFPLNSPILILVLWACSVTSPALYILPGFYSATDFRENLN